MLEKGKGTHYFLPEVLFLEFPPECKTSKRNEQFSLGGGYFFPINYVQIPLTHNSPLCIFNPRLSDFLSISYQYIYLSTGRMCLMF